MLSSVVRRRCLGGLLLAAALLAGTATDLGHVRTARAAGALPEPADFASEAYGDPWDYSNPEDQNLTEDVGGHALGNPRIAAGLLSFDTTKETSLDFLRSTEGSLPWGRDGAAKPVDAGRYTRIAFRAHSDVQVAAGLLWFPCRSLTPDCQGGFPFTFEPGWHTYDFAMKASFSPQDKPWAGQIKGMRMLTGAATNHLDFDWVRLYHPDPASAPGTADPGSVPRRPIPVVDSPTDAGCEDYATAVRGDAWDFSQPTDALKVGNATGVSFTGGQLNATNGGPQRNDPFVALPLAGTIDGSRYHRLTFRYSYDGRFGLEDAPGGGDVSRLLWQVAGSSTFQNLQDVITWPGSNSVTIDLATTPPAAIVEPDQAGRIGWAGQRITSLRFDPNEDPGARSWRLDDVRLAADCTGAGGFDIALHDNAWVPGTTADVFVDTDRAGFDGVPVAQGVAVGQGGMSVRWNLGRGAPGTYWPYVVLHHPESDAAAYASGPVAVSRGVPRLAGTDRVATALAVSAAGYPGTGGARSAVLAGATAFADALAGAPLAVKDGGPLLLTAGDRLDDRVAAELRRLLPAGASVSLLGGDAALSPGVADAVRGLGFTVVRYAGTDRFATAVAIATDGLGSPSTVVETTGTAFPDALAGGAAASAVGGAVLLTDGAAQAPATAAYLAAHPGTRFALGGPAAGADPGATRIAGADRYETAVLAARRFAPSPPFVGLASGTTFPDALAGGADAARRKGPVLLVPAAGPLPTSVASYLSDVGRAGASAVIYGGRAAVGDDVSAAAADRLG